jgi:hypothetical protein
MIVRSKVLWELCIGLLGVLATGLVSADAVTEYTSLASWESAVNNVATYEITGSRGIDTFVGSTPVTYGPGTFTAAYDFGYIYSDGLYGADVQYFSDDPGQRGPTTSAVTVSFNASADVTALAFTLGAAGQASNIDISVNGSAVAPLTVSPAFPTAFFAATDASGPITNIEFTESDVGETDVIGSYATARANAPEIDPASAASGLTLLIGGALVIHGRRRA